MNSLKLSKNLFATGIFIVSFCIFLGIFFLFTHYIHEVGHMVFGFADGLIKGNVTTFTITSWVNHPFLKLPILPQQTKVVNGTGSLNFAMGGPIFSILIFLGLSLFAYLRSGRKLWFLLFFSILIFEISGNIVCGTDNPFGNPLSICNHQVDLTLQFLSIALFAGTFSYFIADRISERYFLMQRFKCWTYLGV